MAIGEKNCLKRGFNEPTNPADIKRLTSGTLTKHLVGAIDLISLPTNIDNLSIVLCSPIRHRLV